MPIGSRPTMHQTFVPFVELYIKGIDVLRSSSNKPRSLISFSHDVYAGAGGFWTLEMFDPDYIAAEEHLLSNAYYAVDTSGEEFGGSEGSGADEKATPVSSVMFRYGYMGHSDKERVVCRGPRGEEFYYGSVHAYVPTYEPNGTRLVIRGDSAGAKWRRHPKLHMTYTGMSILDIVKEICNQRKWTLMVYGATDAEVELRYGQEPEELKVVDSSVDSTEEEFIPFKMREGEDFLSFINRLCIQVRPKDSKEEPFVARLEYRATSKDDTNPKGYLYFGPTSYIDPEPVRQYIYMRDPRSDIISFSTNANIWAAQVTGAAGLVYTIDDSRLGGQEVHTLDELNRAMKHDRGTRPLAAFTLPEIMALQEGVPEKATEKENKAEGGGSGPQRPSPASAPEIDSPAAEMVTAIADRRLADRQAMAYWLIMQSWVTEAQVQIFGDPSDVIQPGKLVTILVFVPTDSEEHEFKLHWTSTVWLIVGVNHEIRPGEMVTNLSLVRNGLMRGGVTTKAAWRALANSLTPGQQRRLGA